MRYLREGCISLSRRDVLPQARENHPFARRGCANSNLDGVLGGGNSLSWGQNQEFHLARRWIPLWRQAFGPGPFSSFTARLARENLLTYPRPTPLGTFALLLGVYWLCQCVKTRLKLASLLYFLFLFSTYTRHMILHLENGRSGEKNISFTVVKF